MTDPTVPLGAESLARIRAGDRQAFESMAEAYYEPLVRYAYRYVREEAAAEDIVQDVLFNLWMARDTLVVRNTLASYLYGAVRNRSLNYLRHRRVEEKGEAQALAEYETDRDLSADSAQDLPQIPDTDAADDDVARRLTAVLQAMAALPPRQREAFRLRTELGMSFAEVAEVMGLTLRSAQTTYMKAVQLLRDRLRAMV